MSGDLHEVSLAIGRLQATVDGVKNGQEVLYAKLDDVHGRVMAAEKVHEVVRRIAPLVDQHEAAAQRSRGVHAALSVGGGVAGSGVVGLIGKKLGWW